MPTSISEALLEMDLKPPHLVIALRNANKHFWHRCWGGHRLKIQHNMNNDHIHVMVAIVYAG
jgi:hypothetical protein